MVHKKYSGLQGGDFMARGFAKGTDLENPVLGAIAAAHDVSAATIALHPPRDSGPRNSTCSTVSGATRNTRSTEHLMGPDNIEHNRSKLAFDTKTSIVSKQNCPVGSNPGNSA